MWVAKQDVHLFPKVNKCYVNCMGDMPEESVTLRIAWASGKLYND